jgi:hypothetical protein
MASDDGNRPAAGEGAQLVKAAKKPLVEKIRTNAGRDIVASLAPSPSTSRSIHRVNHTLYDMTAEHAAALVQSSHSRYAVPAQERTARSVEQTKRFVERTKQLILGGSFGVLFVVGICIRPEAALAISAVAGATGISLVSYDFFNRTKHKERKKLPRAPKD